SLVEAVKAHAVFLPTGTKPQAPVEKQFAVFLRRIGTNGEIWGIASLFGIAEGTTVRYCERVMTAIRALVQEYVVWPREDYRDEVHTGFSEIAGFPSVIDCIDGTHVPPKQQKQGRLFQPEI